MKQSKLMALFEEHKNDKLSWTGNCHCCKKEITVLADLTENGIVINGGAIYQPDEYDDQVFLKCDECYSDDPVLRNFRVTDVYSRTVGYLRPVSAWNGAKQEEFKKRKNYKCLEQADLTV